jgi:hypothetical protein
MRGKWLAEPKSSKRFPTTTWFLIRGGHSHVQLQLPLQLDVCPVRTEQSLHLPQMPLGLPTLQRSRIFSSSHFEAHE